MRSPARVADLCAGDPVSEANLRAEIGRTYATLGELGSAQNHLERALQIRTALYPNDPSKILEVLGPYTSVLDESSDVTTWRRLGEVLPVMRDVVRGTHPDVAAAMDSIQWRSADVGKQREHLGRAAKASMPPDDPAWLVVAQFLATVGNLVDTSGRPALAWPMFRDAVAAQEAQLALEHSPADRGARWAGARPAPRLTVRGGRAARGRCAWSACIVCFRPITGDLPWRGPDWPRAPGTGRGWRMSERHSWSATTRSWRRWAEPASRLVKSWCI
jgi:hypothetical protein